MSQTMDAPEWQMDDAYGAIDSERWCRSFNRVKTLTADVAAADVTRVTVVAVLTAYEEADMLSSSLAAFAKCLGAKNGEDERAASAAAEVEELRADLKDASAKLFAFLGELDDNDALWADAPLKQWQFVTRERKNDWHLKMTDEDRRLFADIERHAFMPLGGIYKNLQRLIDFEAETADGKKERVKAARLVAILKGAPDAVLRENAARGMEAFYDLHSPLYASLLNELHGIRLQGFKRAGVEAIDVSLAQNRMSREALDAIETAIQRNIDKVRKTVSLRSPFLGKTQMGHQDLAAPCPQGTGKTAAPISYEDGIAMVLEALGDVDPEMPAFIQMMLDNRWIDAKPSDKKIGGAFYSRFNEFKIPRVFSSFAGTIAACFQQAHENGHAFHYWVMRDLPTIETEFPMTLTETASTFNEAVMRRHLFLKAAGDERFAMLWQEMKSASNFLMHTMARMSFERAFIEERKTGLVSATRCCELMDDAWKKWFGETVSVDKYLWAFKLHFYKVDQLIYNYPYSVGYLMSLALMRELKVRGKDFYPFYKAMLRDTGRMTVDEIVERHFGADAKDPAFWENAMESVFESIDEFEAMAKDRQGR